LTPAFVADASVCAAWFWPDEATPYTEAALQATAQTNVWVPALWCIEIADLLASAQRRRRISGAKRRELAAAAGNLRLRIDREPVPIAVLDDVAATHGLSAYDATYLELALRRRLPLATLDSALRKAMAAAGVAALEG
jgi:predicted nucleic acid-binding protein